MGEYMKLKCCKSILFSIVVSLLVINGMFAGTVSAMANNDAFGADDEHDTLADFLLKIGEDDKELLFKYIEESDLSETDKTNLKIEMVDAWTRYPNNTEKDHLAANKALEAMVDVVKKEKEIERQKWLENYELALNLHSASTSTYSIKNDKKNSIYVWTNQWPW